MIGWMRGVVSPPELCSVKPPLNKARASDKLMTILSTLTQNRAEKQATRKSQKRRSNWWASQRKERFLSAARPFCLTVEWKSLQTKGQDAACLILHRKAKVSHQNSTEVQTMIVMRRGKWERGAVGFNGRPIKKQIDREKKITARCTIVCFPWSEGCDVCRTHACCHRILILSITHANCCPETLSKTKYDK